MIVLNKYDFVIGSMLSILGFTTCVIWIKYMINNLINI